MIINACSIVPCLDISPAIHMTNPSRVESIPAIGIAKEICPVAWLILEGEHRQLQEIHPANCARGGCRHGARSSISHCAIGKISNLYAIYFTFQCKLLTKPFCIGIFPPFFFQKPISPLHTYTFPSRDWTEILDVGEPRSKRPFRKKTTPCSIVSKIPFDFCPKTASSYNEHSFEFFSAMDFSQQTLASQKTHWLTLVTHKKSPPPLLCENKRGF